MKKTVFNLFFLTVFFVHVQAQKTYKVDYEQDGFKGYVQFAVTLNSYNKGGAGSPVIYGANDNNIVHIITSYMGGKYNAALAKKGITFPKRLFVNTANNGAEISGRAFFYASPKKESVHSAVNLTLHLPDGHIMPNFSTASVDYLREYYKKHNTYLWTLTGGLDQLTVKKAYFPDFKQEVERAVSAYEKEQGQQAQTTTEAISTSGQTVAAQGSTQTATNQTSNKLGVQIADKAGVASSTTAQGGATTTATAVKSEEQLKKEKAEEDYRKAQEAYRQALLDQQRRNRQIEQGVAGVTQGGSDMVTALSGMAGQGANHIIGFSGDFLGGDGEGDDYNPFLLRGQLFYRFQSNQRFAMIGEFGFGYGGMPAPAGEDYDEFDENPGPGFSLAFGLGYKAYKSKTNKSNVMLGVQGGYSMYFANEVADIGFPVVGFIDLIGDKFIYVGFYYGVHYPTGREDTAFGQNRSTPVGGLRIGFPF